MQGALDNIHRAAKLAEPGAIADDAPFFSIHVPTTAVRTGAGRDVDSNTVR